MTTPIGFRPAPAPPTTLWLHTIEFDRDENLAGVVVVVPSDKVASVAELIEEPASTLVVHRDGDEVYLRLNRQQAIDLRMALGKLNEATSPFGDNAYASYSAMGWVENALD